MGSLYYCRSTAVCNICSRSRAWDPLGGAGPGEQAEFSRYESQTCAIFFSRTTLSTSLCQYTTCRRGWVAPPYSSTTAPMLASLSSPSSSSPCRGSRSWRWGIFIGTRGGSWGWGSASQWFYLLRCGGHSVVLRVLSKVVGSVTKNLGGTPDKLLALFCILLYPASFLIWILIKW